MPADPEALIAELRRAPFATAGPLMRALRIGSQATFSRLVARAGDAVLRIGATRARRYAATRPVPDLGASLPLYRVGMDGTLSTLGNLVAVAPEGSCLQGSASLDRWMLGRQGSGVFANLPPFACDLRPQGFLGLGFARRNAALGLPDKPEDWTDDDTLVALANAGEDLAGDLIVGEASARRFYEQLAGEPPAIRPGDRARAFPALAQEAVGGVTPGPSVGGTQPKFGAKVRADDGARRVLVKFSPSEYSRSARRWCDLLACEHLALATLRAHGVDAAESELVEGGSRVFLQVARFDRIGERGRRAVVSLAAMNAEHLAMPPGAGRWNEAVGRLAKDRWVPRGTVDKVRVLDAFGRFIANTDMHFGNLSFLPRGDGTLELAPVYDMLPMGYAPVAGDLPAREFVAPLPDPGHEGAWSRAAAMAADYWRAVSSDERVSDPFRAIAGENATVVHRTLDRFGTSSSAAAARRD